ncbi:MAG: alanine:cation symporter family protein [Neglectibacter sp.]
MATSITGEVYSTQSPLYYALAVVIVVSLGFILFGGMSRVTKVTDKMVPVMAVGYLVLVMILVVCNVTSIPAFFASVIGGAFKPDAIFGGMFGIALIQGIKRGLLSNEAGMGTATMAAAVADNDHPVEQGFIQVFSVFIDTIIISTLTGFVVCMAALWADPSVDWATLSNVKIDIFLQSIEKLMPGNTFLDNIAVLFASLAYGLFGFTTLLGGIVFCEISATKITGNPKIRYVVRFLGAFVFCPIGCITVISGLQLDNLWGISDLNNVVFVFINVITIFVGAKYAFAALKDYVQTEGAPFTEDRIGLSGTVWTKDRK